MLESQQLRKNRRWFLALTGLTPQEFVEWQRTFREAYAKAPPEDKTAQGHRCQRQGGGGRQGRVRTTEQKLLFSWVYPKTYPVQVVLGEVFALSQSRVKRWLHAVLPILKQAVDDLGVVPTREPGQFARHERGHQEAVELSMDGTDRRRQRPQSQEKHALHSSGKPKTPRDKNVGVGKAKTKRVGYVRQT